MKKIQLFIAILAFVSGVSGQIPAKLGSSEKVYGLSKIWQEINYNFVYLDPAIKSRMDSAYQMLIPQVMETVDDYRYYRLLQMFCALAGDGHTSVTMPFEEMNTTFGEYRIGFVNMGGKAIVEGVNLSKKDILPVGSEVLEVNGMPVKEYINREVKPYQPCSNSAVMEDLCIKGLLRGPAGEQYVVKFRKPGGELITLNLTHARTEERETWPAVNRPGLLEFKWLEGKVAYVQLNSFANPKIDSMFVALLPQLYECKGLILDLRNNGGGSSLVGREIFQYLTRDTLLYGSQSFTRQHIALFKAYGAMLRPADTLHGIPARGMSKEDALTYYRAFNDQLGYPLEYSPDTIRLQARRLVVPTVILIGHNTASAAEEFLIYADDQPHMTLIGQPTFGSTGQPYEFSLPGGGKARVCTKKNTYPDGREYVGTGILPDIYTDFTLDDLLKQQDPALKRALLFLAGK